LINVHEGNTMAGYASDVLVTRQWVGDHIHDDVGRRTRRPSRAAAPLVRLGGRWWYRDEIVPRPSTIERTADDGIVTHQPENHRDHRQVPQR
jgi:hypothetical protein